MMSASISVILILAVGTLLDGGHRAWLRTYDAAHGKSRQDALAVATTFGSIGRRSNRINYVLYTIDQGTFLPTAPDPAHPDAVVTGQAVEFRYWDVALDAIDSHGLMDSEKQATAYALFYVEGSQLKVDYGPYPPGGVPAQGGKRNTVGARTVVLAENVAAESRTAPFSHTTSAGVGMGSVRLDLTLRDPDTGDTERVVTATLMRNTWPR
jgi:hypothetical protein